jgi:proline iminopeptidase
MKKIIYFLLILGSVNLTAQSDFTITSTDNTQLHIREFGVGDPLILLAGGPGLTSDYLKPVWEKLSTKYRCIVIDQRGTGKSTIATIDSTNMSMGNYCNDIEALRKHLQLEKINLAGHSWGAMLAMEYTSNYPDKVKNLILLGPGGPTLKFTSYFFDNMKLRLWEEDLNDIELMKSKNKGALEMNWVGYFFNRKEALNSRSIIDFEALNGQPNVGQYTIGNYFSKGDQRVELLKYYKGVVHIIQGRQDPMGESTVYEIKGILPQTQINFIEKCGHFPWLEGESQQIKFYEHLFDSLK